MPSKFVQHAAERAGVSLSTAEERWSEAKRLVKKGKRHGSWYWGRVVNTFKRLMGLNEALTFREFLLIESKANIPQLPKRLHLFGPYFAELDTSALNNVSPEYSAVYTISRLMDDYQIPIKFTVWFSKPGSSDEVSRAKLLVTMRARNDDQLNAQIIDRLDLSQMNNVKKLLSRLWRMCAPFSLDLSEWKSTSMETVKKWVAANLRDVIDTGIISEYEQLLNN